MDTVDERNSEEQLVVAISSRAVFNFEEENAFFERTDGAAYMAFQRQRLDQPAAPGVAFELVRKLLAFDSKGQGGPPAGHSRVEVVVLSRNDPVSGLRVFRSAQQAGLNLSRGVFTGGGPPWKYLPLLKANLFLSANPNDVQEASRAGIPAARVCPRSLPVSESYPNEIRIAFDGDAVLFSDEADQVFREKGLEEFQRHEKEHARRPLGPGPFRPFLTALQRLRRNVPNASIKIRVALVTARSAPAHERAIRTLMEWGVEVDEALFLGGLPKGPFLSVFEPDFFFDDRIDHCASAALFGPTGLVPGADHEKR